MVTDLELLNIASNVYGNVKAGENYYFKYHKLDNETTNWKVLHSKGLNSTSGFYGAVYQKGNEIVIATRGTNNGTDWKEENFDLTWNTSQMQEAREMVREFIQMEGTNLKDYSITFTGHSLGGKLAQQLLVEATHDLIDGLDSDIVKEGVTFNTAPIQNLPNPYPTSDDEINEYLKINDILHSGNVNDFPVRNYSNQSEILSIVRPAGTVVGKSFEVPSSLILDDKTDGPIELHLLRYPFLPLSYYMDIDGNYNSGSESSWEDKEYEYITDYEGEDVSLVGGNNDDILTGGKGNDQLRGGTGNDIYNYTKGDGADYIEETSYLGWDLKVKDQNDILSIKGYTKADLYLSEDSFNLQMRGLTPPSLDGIRF